MKRKKNEKLGNDFIDMYCLCRPLLAWCYNCCKLFWICNNGSECYFNFCGNTSNFFLPK